MLHGGVAGAVNKTAVVFIHVVVEAQLTVHIRKSGREIVFALVSHNSHFVNRCPLAVVSAVGKSPKPLWLPAKGFNLETFREPFSNVPQQLFKLVVVNENNEVLLVSDTRQEIITPEGKIWAFPKGHAENGQNLEQTALREVKEETGYYVEIIKRLPDLTYTQGKTGELIRVAMFKAKPLKLGIIKEIGFESRWFSIDEAKKVIYHNLAFLLNELD